MWYHIDLEKKEVKERVLGRLATRIAKVLMGKHKATFDPSKPGDDYVVVNNAHMVDVSGNKKEQKEYITHSGYLGSIKVVKYKDKIEKDPTSILYLAVKGMLPKNKLRDARLARLKLYADSENPHEAQQPTEFPLNI